MYYVLYCETPMDEEDGYLDIEDGLEIEGVDCWDIGRRFDVDIPNPLQVDLVPVEGYTGEPAEMHDGNILLMSNRLVAALKEAGVDNLDCYPATLKNVETGKTFSYQAVNIIGVMAAADLEKSQWQSYDGEPLFDVNFEGLEINEQAAQGALLFRLAESTDTILIHEKVRDHIIARGIATLKFIRPSDWVS